MTSDEQYHIQHNFIIVPAFSAPPLQNQNLFLLHPHPRQTWRGMNILVSHTHTTRDFNINFKSEVTHDTINNESQAHAASIAVQCCESGTESIFVCKQNWDPDIALYNLKIKLARYLPTHCLHMKYT